MHLASLNEAKIFRAMFSLSVQLELVHLLQCELSSIEFARDLENSIAPAMRTSRFAPGCGLTDFP